MKRVKGRGGRDGDPGGDAGEGYGNRNGNRNGKISGVDNHPEQCAEEGERWAEAKGGTMPHGITVAAMRKSVGETHGITVKGGKGIKEEKGMTRTHQD